MLDVSQIMKDLASMVHEQGDAIGKMLPHLVVYALNFYTADSNLLQITFCRLILI